MIQNNKNSISSYNNNNNNNKKKKQQQQKLKQHSWFQNIYAADLPIYSTILTRLTSFDDRYSAKGMIKERTRERKGF